MTDEKKGFSYYINPVNFGKEIFSLFLSFLFLLNRLFIPILLFVIVVLFVLFGYDRYAAKTYKRDTTSKFSTGSFARSSAYQSPLKQGEKDLSSDLEAFYLQEKRKNKDNEEEHTPVKVINQQPQEATVVNQQQQGTTVVDLKPIWNDEDLTPRLSIQEEVNRRVESIKNDVKSRQK